MSLSSAGERKKAQEVRPGSGDVENYESQLSELNRLTSQVGWEQALKQVFGDRFDQYFDASRARFLDLLPLDGAEVLEIGPGFGQFTPFIAARARRVAALEVDEGQAEFLAQRMRQQGYDHVEVTAGGGNCRLPYPDSSFDLIVLNLVFEWCALRAEGSHYDTQMLLLSEMNRVLRRGGRLYLATKNRYAVRYLTGKPDEHMGQIRFGSALPRWLSAKFQKERPHGMLYSYTGLKRMLEKRGFEVEQSWWAVPDVRYTKELVPFDRASIKSARKSGLPQGSSRSERMIMSLLPAPLVKHFAPGLNFLAVKV